METAHNGGEMSAVSETEDSQLYCSIHNKDWCKDIEAYIKWHCDAQIYWLGKTPRESEAGMVTQHLRLPIIPSHDLWAQADLHHVKENLWKLTLRVKDPDPKQYQEVYLGLTGPGEGRAVWRMLAIDYWRAQCAAEFPKCQSKGHSFRAQVQWTKALELDTTDITYHLNAWTAWYHKLCWYCYRMRDELIKEVGLDLIPQDLGAARLGRYQSRYEDSGEYYGK